MLGPGGLFRSKLNGLPDLEPASIFTVCACPRSHLSRKVKAADLMQLFNISCSTARFGSLLHT
jgi:hypothetical protein